MNSITTIGANAKKSASKLALALSSDKNSALEAIATALLQNSDDVIEANQLDLQSATDNGISTAMLDRLRLTSGRIADIATAIRHLITLEEPIGKVTSGSVRPNGLHIIKVTVPIGVVGIIYESRPNVTVDCAALCIKSGNACILRGGKEAINSNKTLVNIMRTAVESCGLPADCIQLIQDTNRETAVEMMKLNGYIDVLIPRGSAALIASVVKNATVPVIETGAGNCHIFVDKSADMPMAVDIVDNAKTSRPSVCNALETLLVHADIADKFLPLLQTRLKNTVELRGCDKTLKILGDNIQLATELDYQTEFDDYILAIRVVDNTEQAIEHIATYSTHHSEAIVTGDYQAAQYFTQVVDSAAVYVNASTRFTDGAEFGLGAEIGISTQRLHARGPMGLGALTSTKYIINGNGQIRV